MGEWWNVDLVFDIQRAPSPHALEALAVALLDHHGLVSGAPEEGRACWGAMVSVEADDLVAATATATDIVRDAAARAGLPSGPAVKATAMTEDVLDRELARPAFPELVGVSEIAALLARDGKPISRQRASAVAKRQDFPRPVATLASGPVWTKDSVRNFVESWARKPGRPRGAALVT